MLSAYIFFSYFIQTRTLVRIGLNVSCKFFAHKAVDLERERESARMRLLTPKLAEKKKTKEKW